MKVFHIEEFKCTLCSNWFNPPFNLPYRLKCTHSVCTQCLEKSIQSKSREIICPEDLERNCLRDITLNQSTKRALERLLKEHKNFNQTNHLECIKSLSLSFDEFLESREVELRNLSTLVGQVFQNEVRRLREIEQNIKMEINRPFKIVNDWKEVVRANLKRVKDKQQQDPSKKSPSLISEFNHYIEEGRKIKLDLSEYSKYDFQGLIDALLETPQLCFTHNFSIFDSLGKNLKKKSSLTKDLLKVGKLKENRTEDSVHRKSQKAPNKPNHDPNPLNQTNSLFEELMAGEKAASNLRKGPLNELILSNNKEQSQGSQQKGAFLSESFHLNLADSHTASHPPSDRQAQVKAGSTDYNAAIREKIKKLKQSQIYPISSEKNGNVGHMRGSLEYSPDNIADQFEIQDSCGDCQIMTQDYISSERSRHDSSSFNNQSTVAVQNSSKQVFSHTNIPNDRESELRTQNVQSEEEEEEEEQEEEMLLNSESCRKPQKTLKVQRKSKSKERKRSGSSLARSNSSKALGRNPSFSKLKSPANTEGINFLRSWNSSEFDRSRQPEKELEVVQRAGYNCEEEKSRYAHRIQENRVRELLAETHVGLNYVELVGHSLHDADLGLYLGQVDWARVEIVKLIKTCLSDAQLGQLLNCLLSSRVHTLMLSFNGLGEPSLDALLHFVELRPSQLRNVYLPKNNISLLKGQSRAKINLLKERGINLYI